MLSAIPTKIYGYGTFLLLIVSFGLMREYPVSSLLLIAASAFCMYFAMTPDERASKHKRNQSWLIAVAFYVPTLFAFWNVYSDETETRHFKSYLAAHNCQFAETVETGYTNEECDKMGNCVEGHEVVETVYVCGATGNRITFSDYTKGGFGLPE